MPRVDVSREARSSTTSDAASMPKTRRALDDMSNRGASQEAATKKPGNPPVRRSKRLSKGSAADSATSAPANPRPTRRTSSRTQSNAAAAARPTNQQKQSKVASLENADAGKNKKARPGRIVKRSRVEALEEAAPVKKRRSSSRGRKSHDATDDSPIELKSNNPCADLLQDGNFGLRRDPFDDTKYTLGLATFDEVHKNDLRHVSDYVTDIYQRLYDAENKTRPHPYMNAQPELNALMRSILIDWIVEVHLKFRLIPETLYLAINIIDRYLQREKVQRKRLQLVGVTALLIACKYEEIYPPEVKDCVYITDRAYTRQDVLDMEAHIVKTLKFRMTVPTGYPFLRRFLHICNATGAAKCLANFYMERMLQEYNALEYKPSLVAATAVSLSINNPDALESEGYALNEAPGVPESLLKYSGFRTEEIMEVAMLMENKVGEVDTTYSRRSLNSVKKKYASDKFENVSSFILPSVDHLG